MRSVVLAHSLLFAAQESNEPVLERLEPRVRVAVVMALLGLTLVGLFLVVLAMIGGHWVRQLARHRPASKSKATTAADVRQLRQALQTILPDMKTGDTVLFDGPSKETKIDT